MFLKMKYVLLSNLQYKFLHTMCMLSSKETLTAEVHNLWGNKLNITHLK